MKISKQQIEQFQKKNEKDYKKSISGTLFSLENSEVYNIFKNSFEKESKPFVVTDFLFEERLTNLVGLDYFNTVSYLELNEIDEKEIAKVKHELLWESKEFSFIFESASTALFDSKQKVIRVQELEENINDYQIELYKKFIGVLKKQISNNYIPKIINLSIQFKKNEIDDELLIKKIKDLGYEIKELLADQLASLLNKRLKDIYKEYGLNAKNKQTTSESKKIPFSDFDESNQLFKANFDDEELALRTLGLDKSATVVDIKKAYKKLAMKYHPDRNHSEFAAEQMEKINSAYNLLKKRLN